MLDPRMVVGPIVVLNYHIHISIYTTPRWEILCLREKILEINERLTSLVLKETRQSIRLIKE